MAGLGDLLQRIARSLEEANAQRPADDLRTRLGYGTGDDDEEDPASEAGWELEGEPEAGSATRPHTVWKPPTARRRDASPTPAQAAAALRASAAPGVSRPGPVSGLGPQSRAAPARPPEAPASVLSERIRARLRTPDALREAFVVKEVLDRPLGRRRSR